MDGPMDEDVSDAEEALEVRASPAGVHGGEDVWDNPSSAADADGGVVGLDLAKDDECP